MMQAAVIHAPGPAACLSIEQVEIPSIQDHQVLVKVETSAVNPIDTYLRSGVVAADLPDPWIPGCDFAGIITECGAAVTNFSVGQKVWGSNQGLFGNQGTLAEFVAVDEQWLYHRPDHVSAEICAATSLTGITAHLGLFQHAKLRATETVFVNGGTGGVGSMVVQLAKSVGAKVITTARSDQKCQLASQLGADLAINYRPQDVAAAIESKGNEIDVWFETLRNPNPTVTIPLMARKGRYVVMAGRDAQPEFPIGPFYVKNLSMLGFAMFNATAEEQRTCANDINRLLANGQLKPIIGATFSLQEAAQAHQLQEDATLTSLATFSGKIVVKIGDTAD
ncbi:MAG: NADPH:quinone reductase [Fuerstiella sp.]